MSDRFEIQETPLRNLKVITRKRLGDHRGYLERMFCLNDFGSMLDGRHIVQINHTFTHAKGTVRGMHFQYPPHAEIKFVSCIRGTVFDVAVDLRKDSPTYLRWHAQLLSEENVVTYAIPEGFAHGFQTLTDDCEMLYLHTTAYAPEAESGLNPLDPTLAVEWPLAITEISARDKAHSSINAGFGGISL
jgi:dTDP-4-dehydrorhamnose 3,5-epimerase